MCPQSDREFDVTQYLSDLKAGNPGESEATLMQLLYEQLRVIALSCMSGQRQDHTLQPTALVNEAYLKLFRSTGDGWNDRRHFYAAAAKAMRQLLVDHARARGSQKRGGGTRPVALDEAVTQAARMQVDVLELDGNLSILDGLDPRAAQVVELRCFGGLEMAEIAEVLETSKSTIEREWRFARAWISQRIEGELIP